MNDKYLEVINRRIRELEKERDMLLKDYTAFLKTFAEYTEQFKIEHETINIVTNYFSELSIINRELQLLNEIKKEAEIK